MMVPRRPGTSPSPTCCWRIAIASFGFPVAWYCNATSRRVRARKRKSIPCLAMSSACKPSASASLLRASKARAAARSNKNCARFGPLNPLAGAASAVALRFKICASSGFSPSRIAVMSAIVRGGATKEVRISSGASGAVDASFGAAGAATPAACFCSSRNTQGRTIAPPHACRAFSSSGPIALRGLPTLSRTQARNSSICACLHASIICSCEAARAVENEAMMANAAQSAVARPRHALSRSGMRFPSTRAKDTCYRNTSLDGRSGVNKIENR